MNEDLARLVHAVPKDRNPLPDARVVVVGVGGLGTELARILVQSGVRRLVLCDPDVVEESNLSRGSLFRVAHVGRPKVEAAAEALAEIAPDVVVDARADDFRYSIGLGELRDAHLVLSCLDSVADRIELCGRCSFSGNPRGLLDAGLHPWGGEVRHYPPDGACYACRCSPLDRSMPAWHEACGLPPVLGAPAPVVALIAGWQAVYAVRLLFGEGLPEQITAIEAAAGQSRTVHVEPSEDCILHARLEPDYVTSTALTPESTVGDLLSLVDPQERVHSWHPIDRADASSTLDLAAADPGRTLHDVGVPPAEILPVYRESPLRHVRYLALKAAS